MSSRPDMVENIKMHFILYSMLVSLLYSLCLDDILFSG